MHEQPSLAGPEKTYLEALSAGLFQIQKCSSCLQHVFYPRVLCPHCGSEQLDWVRASGFGTVYSTTAVRAGKDAGGPYNVALVDLREGPRVMSSVVGIAPADVRIGLLVRARVDVDAGKGVLRFEPCEAAP